MKKVEKAVQGIKWLHDEETAARRGIFISQKRQERDRIRQRYMKSSMIWRGSIQSGS